MSARRPKTYREFWPYYLSQHRDRTCRRLHFTGTTLALTTVAVAANGHAALLAAAPVAGYGFAWVGHFFFEKNRPATFRYPLWSLRADFEMYFKMLLGRKLR
ncbi:MAG: DUF962 domain-containing protein [Deltaproteobacteria bacterium]|nr:DUF962 domain-containing protein [Deltaproteobacteria bacterium]